MTAMPFSTARLSAAAEVDLTRVPAMPFPMREQAPYFLTEKTRFAVREVSRTVKLEHDSSQPDGVLNGVDDVFIGEAGNHWWWYLLW